MYDDEVEALKQYNAVGIVLVSALVIVGTFLMLEIIELVNKLAGNQDSPCSRRCEIPYSYAEPNGPQAWHKMYPACCGIAQSPINVDTKASTCMELCEPLVWKNYDKTPISMMIKNTGHTVQLTGQWMKGCQPLLSGGALGDKLYKFKEINLRWGVCDSEGSEHTIDFERFALEMQLMHINVSNPDDVACISYLFQLSYNDNPLFNNILNGLWEIVSPGIAAWINPFPLRCILCTFAYKYFSYAGSLTYPPCTENVQWIIYPEYMKISSRQVDRLRQLYGKNGPIVTNSRPVQCVNDRMIYYFSS